MITTLRSQPAEVGQRVLHPQHLQEMKAYLCLCFPLLSRCTCLLRDWWGFFFGPAYKKKTGNYSIS